MCVRWKALLLRDVQSPPCTLLRFFKLEAQTRSGKCVSDKGDPESQSCSCNLLKVVQQKMNVHILAREVMLLQAWWCESSIY